MKIYSVIRATRWGCTYTYFGAVSKKRTGFNNENVVGVMTFNKNGELVGGVTQKNIFDVKDARKKWFEYSKGEWGTSIAVESEGIDVFKPNGKEPMMDSEVTKAIDTYAREMYDERQ
jgi:hypothetical protein